MRTQWPRNMALMPNPEENPVLFKFAMGLQGVSEKVLAATPAGGHTVRQRWHGWWGRQAKLERSHDCSSLQLERSQFYVLLASVGRATDGGKPCRVVL